MKKIKAIISAGLIFCTLFSLAGFSSCGGSGLTTPFSYTEIKSVGSYVSYVHTKGERSTVVYSDIEETAYYIELSVLSTDDGITVNAGDISIIADGKEYSSYAFVSFSRTVGEISADGIQTTVTSYKEQTASLTLDYKRSGATYRAAFYLPSAPESYSAFYKGEALKVSLGDDVSSAKYNVEENLFIAVAASETGENEAKAVQSVDIGAVSKEIQIVDERILEGIYNYVEVQITVGTEDVTAYASEFSLSVDGVSYPCIGFAEESSTYTEDGGISVTEVKVALYGTYIIESSEVAALRPAFDVDIGESDFELYYGGVKLS